LDVVTLKAYSGYRFYNFVVLCTLHMKLEHGVIASIVHDTDEVVNPGILATQRDMECICRTNNTLEIADIT
jgi:hypothetical protein